MDRAPTKCLHHPIDCLRSQPRAIFAGIIGIESCIRKNETNQSFNVSLLSIFPLINVSLMSSASLSIVDLGVELRT